ncbi:hypothetical protein M3P05_20775, partial [Sansalvadorimonas sp. 2012CJ34-2]
MRKLILLLVVLASGCVSYQVQPKGQLQNPVISKELSITRDNIYPMGKHCFEPMLYVLTLGIIPAHCENIYTVSADNEVLGKVKVTSMQGWAALFSALSSEWK